MRNVGRLWLQEDVINLLEMKHQQQSWQSVASVLGRSVNACKMRYGMIRFTYRMSDEINKIQQLTIMDRIKE